MNSNELFQEFLKHCTKYELDLNGIVMKKENISLRITKPFDPEKNNYLIYEIIEGARFTATVSDLDTLLDLCIDTIGEDCIIKNSEQELKFNPYGYK